MPLPVSVSGHKIEPSVQPDANKQKSPQHAAAGSDREIHAAQKFITTDLIKQGKVKLSDLGTDLDIINCLGKDSFTEVSTITKPGAYIVKPCELTSAKLKAIIEDGLHAETSAIELFVPVCFRSHWRLVKLKIKDNALIEATLWDPLAINNKVAYKLLQDAIEAAESKKAKKAKKAREDSNDAYVETVVAAKAIAAKVQTNAHSCMDYVIQEMYKSKSLSLDNDAIEDAPDANALRLAVVKQIATNVTELGKTFSDNLKIDGEYIAEEVALTDEQEKFLEKISKGGKVQVEFDDEFAKQIQRLQKSICSESKLQKVAFVKAYSIFKQKSAQPEESKQVASSSMSSSSSIFRNFSTPSTSSMVDNVPALNHRFASSLGSKSILPLHSSTDRIIDSTESKEDKPRSLTS